MDHSNGEAIITIDADLQDPPELIPQMLNEWSSGHRMVYCRRVSRPGETRVKIWTANIYYRLIRWLSDMDLPRNVGDFRLMDKEVVAAVRFSDEKSLYLRGLTSWVGYASSEIQYERSERTKGETKYTLKKMIGLGSDGIISFSDKPLRLVARMGVIVTVLGSLLGFYFVSSLIFLGVDATPGWMSVVLIVLSLSGMQLLSLGVVGLYVSRIYREVKGRQTYIIDMKKSSEI
jgi:dolichol-phosphate mannosyltransferase